jgi:hypothetical protein
VILAARYCHDKENENPKLTQTLESQELSAVTRKFNGVFFTVKQHVKQSLNYQLGAGGIFPRYPEENFSARALQMPD